MHVVHLWCHRLLCKSVQINTLSSWLDLTHTKSTLSNTCKGSGKWLPKSENTYTLTRSWLRRSIMHVTLPFLVHATVCVVCSITSVHISEWVMMTSCPAGLGECTLIYGIEMCRCVCIYERHIITGGCSGNIFSPGSLISFSPWALITEDKSVNSWLEPYKVGMEMNRSYQQIKSFTKLLWSCKDTVLHWGIGLLCRKIDTRQTPTFHSRLRFFY